MENRADTEKCLDELRELIRQHSLYLEKIQKEPLFNIESLQELVEVFYKDHPGLHEKVRTGTDRDREKECVKKFLFWLKLGEYDVERNWTYGSF